MRRASSVSSTVPRRFALLGVGSFAPLWLENTSVDETRKEQRKNTGSELEYLLIVESLGDGQGREGERAGTRITVLLGGCGRPSLRRATRRAWPDRRRPRSTGATPPHELCVVRRALSTGAERRRWPAPGSRTVRPARSRRGTQQGPSATGYSWDTWPPL